MVATVRKYTIEDLWRLPADAPYELWRGELIEVPAAGQDASAVAVWFIVRLALFVEAHGLGVVTGPDGGFILFHGNGNDTVVVPDVGFVRWERLPGRKRARKHCPVPPDFAIEVQSPSDEPGKMRAKVDLYMAAGVPLLWWVDVQKQVVRVHRPGKPVVVLREGDVLDGEDVLPGFRLAVADVFAA
jgi:Uma2 family endonuclease